MTGSLSRFEFAGDAAYTRRIMDYYATFFDRGPVADLGPDAVSSWRHCARRGVEGIGVDSSDEALAIHHRERDLKCVKADVLDYLRGTSNLEGIFAPTSSSTS